MERVCLTVLGAALLFCVGCFGGDKSGTFPVKGTVTYDGKPVPVGFVTFSPDYEKGNSGPGGGAPIKDGKFETELGKGVVGGPYEVRIVGYTGQRTTESGEELQDGPPLFPAYTTTMDFPKEASTQDFVIPTK